MTLPLGKIIIKHTGTLLVLQYFLSAQSGCVRSSLTLSRFSEPVHAMHSFEADWPCRGMGSAWNPSSAVVENTTDAMGEDAHGAVDENATGAIGNDAPGAIGEDATGAFKKNPSHSCVDLFFIRYGCIFNKIVEYEE